MPNWSPPADLDGTLEEEGEVEIPGWDPIAVTVLGPTIWLGRDIDKSWQIEVPAGTKGLDGHDLETLILDGLRRASPALADRCHSDSEGAACVLWVEEESDCRALVEFAWPLLV